MSIDTREFSTQVAEEVLGLSLDDLSEVQIQRAKHMVLDWLAVTIGGASDPSSRIAQRLAVQDECAPTAAIIGTEHRTSTGHAAFANAMAANALGLADSSWWTGGHPGATVMSAAVAIGEPLQVSGRDLIEAVVAGLQGQARIYLAGAFKDFDPAGLHNGFGGAGACARLLGLDADATARTFSLIATQTAGLMVGLETMASHVNAAHAAAIAVASARLVAEGLTAPIDSIETPRGFMAAYSDAFDPNGPDEVMANRLAVENLYFKRHACAGGTHSAIDGVAELRGTHDFSPDQVHEVRILSAPDMIKICGISDPATGAEGKFSLRYGAALALTDLPTGPESFTDEVVLDPALVQMRQRIVVTTDPTRPVATMRVEIDLADGTQLATDVRPTLSPVDDRELGQEWDLIVGKVGAYAAPVVGDHVASELVAAVSSLENVTSIADVLKLAVPG